MLKVLTIGYSPQELPPSEGLIFSVHQPGLPYDMGEREYYLKCRKMVEESDVLIVKSNERNLREDEVVLLYSAYTKPTPIFRVGPSTSPLLELVTTDEFGNLDSLIEHIRVYYMPKIIM